MNLDFRAQLGNEAKGKEIFEIHPIILGGSATNPMNKVLLSREKHIQAVVYWNREIRRLAGQLHVPSVGQRQVE